MLRFARLALIGLCALPPALARAQALDETDVVGAWGFDSDVSPGTDPDSHLKVVFHLRADHSWEERLWLVDRTGPEARFVDGLYTGAWFLRDSLLAVVTAACQASSEAGMRECGYAAKSLPDTSFLRLETGKDGKPLLRDTTLAGMIGYPYQGTQPDFAPPSWAPGPVAARGPGDGRVLRGDPDGARSYDLLGRRPAREGGSRPDWLLFRKAGPQ
jgi:hypothetical protein